MNDERNVVGYHYPLLVFSKDKSTKEHVEAVVINPGEVQSKDELFEVYFDDSDTLLCVPIETTSYIESKTRINTILDEFQETGDTKSKSFVIFK